MTRAFSVLVFSVAGIFFFSASQAFAEHTRVTHPNSLNIELLGRAFSGSLNYDRVLNDELAAGAGFGRGFTQEGQPTAQIVNFYINYYVTPDAGSLFATVGADIITNSSEVEGSESRTSGIVFPSNSVLPVVGVGYEVRQDAGFLFRGAAYAISAEEFKPWFGFSLGLAF